MSAKPRSQTKWSGRSRSVNCRSRAFPRPPASRRTRGRRARSARRADPDAAGSRAARRCGSLRARGRAQGGGRFGGHGGSSGSEAGIVAPRTCQALSGICRHTPGDACQPPALDPAHPAEQGPGQRPGARRRARGLGAHHLSRHRPPQRRRRAGLGRPRPPGRLPAQGGLADPAHRPDRGRGAGPVHGRPARAGEGPRACRTRPRRCTSS